MNLNSANKFASIGLIIILVPGSIWMLRQTSIVPWLLAFFGISVLYLSSRWLDRWAKRVCTKREKIFCMLVGFSVAISAVFLSTLAASIPLAIIELFEWWDFPNTSRHVFKALVFVPAWALMIGFIPCLFLGGWYGAVLFSKQHESNSNNSLQSTAKRGD